MCKQIFISLIQPNPSRGGVSPILFCFVLWTQGGWIATYGRGLIRVRTLVIYQGHRVGLDLEIPC